MIIQRDFSIYAFDGDRFDGYELILDLCIARLNGWSQGTWGVLLVSNLIRFLMNLWKVFRFYLLGNILFNHIIWVNWHIFLHTCGLDRCCLRLLFFLLILLFFDCILLEFWSLSLMHYLFDRKLFFRRFQRWWLIFLLHHFRIIFIFIRHGLRFFILAIRFIILFLNLSVDILNSRSDLLLLANDFRGKLNIVQVLFYVWFNLNINIWILPIIIFRYRKQNLLFRLFHDFLYALFLSRILPRLWIQDLFRKSWPIQIFLLLLNIIYTRWSRFRCFAFGSLMLDRWLSRRLHVTRSTCFPGCTSSTRPLLKGDLLHEGLPTAYVILTLAILESFMIHC